MQGPVTKPGKKIGAPKASQKTEKKSAETPEVTDLRAEKVLDSAKLVQDSLTERLPTAPEPLEQSPTSELLPVSRTPSLADPLTLYLNEIRRYAVLSKEEELRLAKLYAETKKPEYAQALVTANLRFVVKIAAEYARFGARMIDLIQEGNMGLMHAVREFDPSRDVRLISYAVWWIRGYIQEYLMKQYSLVKIGTTQAQKKLFYQLEKEKQALDAMGFSPSAALIGSRLGVQEKDVTQMSQRLGGRDVSLDAPLDEESQASLKDLQRAPNEAPDESLAREELLHSLKDRIDELRPSLSEREKIILDERLLNEEPLTLQEIGEKYGITREAVRQMEARLMNKIRSKMSNLT